MAEFRQFCRPAGSTEVTLGSPGLRIAPVTLPESGHLRIARLYSGSKYRVGTSVLVLKPPTERGRTGTPVLRDRGLLAYLDRVLDDNSPVGAGASPVGGRQRLD